MRLLMCLLLTACGGKAFIDGGSGGSSGSSTSASSTSKSTSATSSTITTTPVHCSAHSDCPGGVCIFSTGQCTEACQGDFCATCRIGLICDSCATSSCPKCADCMGACVPLSAGQCDDLNACPPNMVCIFGSQTCAPLCDANGGCSDPNMVCEMCVTGSCCGCDNCVSACVQLEG